MCLGGPADYSAYTSGDFANWKTAFDQSADIDYALARGEITEQQAADQKAALGTNEELNNKIKQDAAALMESREMGRQRDVKIGQIGIDRNFEKFNDQYYDGYKTDYNSHYMPQIDDQYSQAVDKMTAQLANRGVLESSAGAGGFAELGKQNAQARIDVANEGLDAANKLRGQVAQSKSNLYNLNEASANPQAVNAQAVGQATSIVAPPQYSPLGQIFATTLSNFAPFARNVNSNQKYSSYTSPFGAGSSSVVKG